MKVGTTIGSLISTRVCGVWIKEEDEIIMDAFLSKWAGIANILSNFVGTAHSKIGT